MGTKSQRGGDNWESRIGAELLELLHREADDELSSTEQATLENALASQPALKDTRIALAHGVTLLAARPPLPSSVAPAVMSEIRLARQLAAPLPPSSVAVDVAAEIAAAATLTTALTYPPSPRSVSAAVQSKIALERTLKAGPVPPAGRSVVPAVLSEIRTATHLAPPASPPRSISAAVAAQIGREAQVRTALQQAVPPPPRPSVAASLAARIAHEAYAQTNAERQPALPVQPQPFPALPVLEQPVNSPLALTSPLSRPPVRSPNRAPLLLVAGLLAGLTLLTVTSAWPNLQAGALILQTLLENVAPLAGLGLLLLVLTSALVTWTPTPPVRRFGAAAFAVAGVLTLPPLYQVANGGNGLSFGQTVVVQGRVPGNIVSIGGDVKLEKDAQVEGRVVTLLGDIRQDPGAKVEGETSALLGHAPGTASNFAPPPQGIGIATAAAFRPLIGWLGAAAWPQIFVTMTAGLLLLLFVAGTAPVLARRQRHAPMQSLALGILMLSVLLFPALALGLSGLLGASLLMLALVGVLIATGLSVSLYDGGRALACRLRLPVPDTVGAFIGLSTFAASLSWPPLAFVLALIGGAWGAGTLFLHRQANRHQS